MFDAQEDGAFHCQPVLCRLSSLQVNSNGRVARALPQRFCVVGSVQGHFLVFNVKGDGHFGPATHRLSSHEVDQNASVVDTCVATVRPKCTQN